MSLDAGKLRFRVDVMTPADATDAHGQDSGQDAVFLPGVPCSIDTLNGREGELARQQYGSATHRVRMYGDPSRPLAHSMYLRTIPDRRRLEIGFINDTQQNGVVYELLCGEVLA